MMEEKKHDLGLALYNVKDHSDLTVILSDGEVYVHKCVLVTICEHFKSMLLGPWADQNIKSEIHTKNFKRSSPDAKRRRSNTKSPSGGEEKILKPFGEHSDPSPEKRILDMTSYNPCAYRGLLKYVYTGMLDPMEGEDLIDLFDISKSYLEDKLVKVCSKMFVKTIKANNVAVLYKKASDNNCEELLGKLVRFASRHLEEVITSEGFENLESHLAKKLVVDASKLSMEKKSITSPCYYRYDYDDSD